MRVLVIAPHLDDEVLGVGGTILRHIANGDKVFVVVIANREYNNKFNRFEFKKELKDAEEIRKFIGYDRLFFLNYPDAEVYLHLHKAIIDLEKVINTVQPEIVYTCFGGDVHQDHKSVFDMTMIALRPISACGCGIKRILVYETPSCTDQSLYPFQPNVYIDVVDYFAKKLRAISLYKREERFFPHPRSSGMITALAQKRGCESGFVYAEAFQLIRERLWNE